MDLSREPPQSCNWTRDANDKNGTEILCTDIEKAFDRVPHDKLLAKLRLYGINDSLWLWIREFLNNRWQQVTVDGVLSDKEPVSSGVVQGSALGPALFILYTNDAPKALSSPYNIWLFADDAKICGKTKDHESFQNDCLSFFRWCEEWDMKPSMPKCSLLHIGPDGTTQQQALSNLLDVPVLEVVRDLGVYIDCGLKFTHHCATIAVKGSRIANLILRIFKSKDQEIYRKAFITYVRPILEYASPVWSPRLIKDVNAVEDVQRRFTRRVMLRCHRTHPSYQERLQVLRLESLEQRRVLADLNLVHDLVHHRPDDVFHQFFNYLSSRSRGHSLRIIVPHFTPRSETARAHFAWRVTALWNALPENVAHIACKKGFKRALGQLPVLSYLPTSKIR